jgi:hypothetical protein
MAGEALAGWRIRLQMLKKAGFSSIFASFFLT